MFADQPRLLGCRKGKELHRCAILDDDPSGMWNLTRYLLVLIGGATGALARYVAASAIMTRFGGKFPLGTLVINITGSFLIGFVMTMLTERFLDPRWRLLLVVG